jgi:hypothetical protein
VYIASNDHASNDHGKTFQSSLKRHHAEQRGSIVTYSTFSNIAMLLVAGNLSPTIDWRCGKLICRYAAWSSWGGYRRCVRLLCTEIDVVNRTLEGLQCWLKICLLLLIGGGERIKLLSKIRISTRSNASFSENQRLLRCLHYSVSHCNAVLQFRVSNFVRLFADLVQ